MKIICKTQFDCTYTSVTGNFRINQVPFVSRAGVEIADQAQWNRARNQQRNWETLLQIISLTAQPENIVVPSLVNGMWQFEFYVASPDVFGMTGNPDPLAGLKANCNGVPMMTGLGEIPGLEPVLMSSGPAQNIWFDSINIGLE